MKAIYTLYYSFLKIVASMGVTHTGWYTICLLLNAGLFVSLYLGVLDLPLVTALFGMYLLVDTISTGARMYVATRMGKDPAKFIKDLVKGGREAAIQGVEDEDFETRSAQAVKIINAYGDKFSKRMSEEFPAAVPGDETAERVLREVMDECNAELHKLGMSIKSVSPVTGKPDVTSDTPPTDKRKLH